jgi:hypothetical protein
VTSVLFQQLRTHIQELEDVKDQISEEDQNEFNQIIQPIQERILQSIESFESVDPNIPRMLEDDELSQDDDYITITQTEVTEAANEVWTELHTELEELKGLSRTLLEQVQDQDVIVERLDIQMNEAELHVQNSLYTLQRMAKMKSIMLPVGGALLGGIVGGVMGGPVGLLAGVNAGTLVAVAGGTAGAVGGGLIGYKRGQNIKEHVDELTPKKNQ